MKIISTIKNNKIVALAFLAYAVAFLWSRQVFIEGLGTTGSYLIEMVQVLPAVFVISGLITVWVPQNVIILNFGKDSGIRGKLISIFLGSVSAGPIYAAFPVASSLLKKGASIGNVITIISAWAVVKVPMLIVETRFLGLPFALSRYLFTIPGILIIAYVCDYLLDIKDIPVEEGGIDGAGIDRVSDMLPGNNCGACGYNSCREYAGAFVQGEAGPDLCKIAKRDLSKAMVNEMGNG